MKLTPINIEIIVKAHKVLGSPEAVHAWMITPNLNFGNVPPKTLISRGLAKRLLSFINTVDEMQKQTEASQIRNENPQVSQTV